MMLEFQKPIPVVVEGNKEGYAIYVTNGGTFENDIWCVVLCDGGNKIKEFNLIYTKTID